MARSATRLPGRLYQCAWCGGRFPIAAMRHPGSAKGVPPSTCQACREANPTQSWCDHHGKPHARREFNGYGRRRPGFEPSCRQAAEEIKSARRGLPDIECPACSRSLPSWRFRGGRVKSVTCRDCQGARSGMRWCVDCKEWLPEREFTRTGVDRRFSATRCRLCRAAYSHGTTVALVLAAQGTDRPMCGACGAADDLKVDHDHACCPTQRSCGRCIRGYLCHPCNAAEGLLRTPERARALAVYMERNGVRA